MSIENKHPEQETSIEDQTQNVESAEVSENDLETVSGGHRPTLFQY